MKRTVGTLLLTILIGTVAMQITAAAGPQLPANTPCLERSWIPRTGMPTAEKEWRLVRLVDCAVRRWWPGPGHTLTVLSIAARESCQSCTFAVNPTGCGGYGCLGAWQHSGRYLPGRWAFYLRPEWFRHWPVSWHNARAQAIVTVRMLAAQDGACPAWCVG